MIITFNVLDSSSNNIKGITFIPKDGEASTVENSPFTYDYGSITEAVTAIFDRIGYSPASKIVEIDGTSYTISMRAVTYCSIQDVRNMIAPMVKGVIPAVLSDELIENNIQKGESLIDTYVGSRYTIPFAVDNMPKIIKTICVDLACYYSLVSLFTRDSINSNEWVEQFYTRHIDIQGQKDGTLDMIKDGGLPVLLPDGTEAPMGTESITSNTDGYVPTFDVDSPLDWKVDKNRLEDVEANRDI